MTIALLTPHAVPSLRGNAVTVARVARGLERLGVPVSVVDLSRCSTQEVRATLDETTPRLVHAFHAFLAGPPALEYALLADLPLVVSLTGTDVNHDLYDPTRRVAVGKVLEAANALTVFHETVRTRVADLLPGITPKISVIPQGVWLGETAYPLSSLIKRRPDEILFLVPAGIRAIKNARFALGPLGRLGARVGGVRLLFAGPILEEEEGKRLLEAIAARPWAAYLGPVPHDQMASLLRQVDVVINSSLSEGGMANSVLEAMSLGRAILASNIEGNRSILADEVDGLLYRSEEDFEAKAERLIRDPALGAHLGERARLKVMREFSPEREARAYLALYQGLVGRLWSGVAARHEVGAPRGG